ncbi:arsenate reductase [Cohaesibacter celericrescens]|uniref:Arsenate reductase n=1 Tax=Cohaesibacter celericrescens TaxID=2067669 RepID=A0A2N5XK09_9HYPH|nr:arsenate reductase [Cohaesibacter celericrescens]PLW74856.1 arsenate reductase [Cohaesibacter celericrescens]
MKLYGIKTCDTCRKALKAFEAAGKPISFVDLRVDGFNDANLDRWLDAVGWEALLNRRSTSWRALSDEDKAEPNAIKARALMLAHPTLIKRPVFESDTEIVVGFGKAQQSQLLG